MDKLFIIGNGSHASEVTVYVKENATFEIAGYIIDDEYYNTTLHANVWPLSNFINHYKDQPLSLISAVASNHKKTIINKLENLGFKFISVVHPTAYISASATINPGVCIAPQCTINVNVYIGKHTIVNSNCNISHDCKIGDFVTISPTVTLTGNVTVKNNVFIGAGTTILPNIIIGEGAIIGAGACVTSDIPDNCTAVGVPAKIIKHN